MNALIIKQTIDTPSIVLDPINRIFIISGESRPENPREFFKPVLDWLLAYENTLYYLKNEGGKTIELNFTFKLDYFNSATAKYILDILLIIKKFQNNGYIYNILWYYDERDDDMLNSGQEFQSMTLLNFIFRTLV